MNKTAWIIIIGILIAAGIFVSVYQTRIRHYALPEGTAPERPVE